jgi:DNA-binding NarL/FixJ family response regulator
MPRTDAKSIRILLIDDHELVRAGLRLLIGNQPEMKMIGETGDRAEALSLAASEQPNIILLDLDLGDANGLDLIPELTAAAAQARIIILTGVRDAELHQSAVRLGAMGVVLKSKAAEVLIKAISKVYAGEVWLDSTTTAKLLGELSRPRPKQPADPEAAKIATLTKREREIIPLVGEGLKNKQIADRLFISETTVRHHLASIFDKLGVSDRFGLIILAYRHGLAKPPR